MKKGKYKNVHTGLIFAGALILFVLVFFVVPHLTAVDLVSPGTGSAINMPAPPLVTHLATPDTVKAIYMTACVASTPSWRTSMKKLIEETELNTVVIDIKDYSGTISFVDNELQPQGGVGCRVADMREFINELHAAGIYVIGRIAVFQDPLYTSSHPELAVKKKSDGGVWRDYKGLPFIDVGATSYWDYIILLSKKSYALGFDELNYDYVRYPSDGNMKDASYSWTGSTTKAVMLKNFFAYLHENTRDIDVVLSVDIFGMTTTNTDDLGIGQVLENTFPYFDYIAPMVYPSHYPPHFNGWPDPNAVPYDIIKFAMGRAMERLNTYNATVASTTAEFRPWLQDNDYPVHYTPAMVRAQIQATYDVGIDSWMLWDAGNTYTREALLDE